MIGAKRPQSIDELEQHFDEALSRLRVYDLPLPVALRASLVVFEESHSTVTQRIPERFSGLAAMLHYKDALEILMPNLFKRCRPEGPSGEAPIVASNILDTVTDAFHFCERYHFVVHSYTLYHQKQFTGSLSDRVADFQYSSDINLGRSSLNLLLTNYHERRTENWSWQSRVLPPSVAPNKTREALANRVKSADVRTVFCSTPDEVYIPIREIVQASMLGPTVDINASCGSYSIGDCYNFWVEFMVRTLAYKQACEEKSKMDASFDLSEHRILRTTLSELCAILTNRGTVDRQLVFSILSDLVFDSAASRPDILVQPLVAIPDSGTILIAPSLIYTTNWEVCALRNWTRLYPRIYGKVIAGKKGELAKSLRAALASRHFVTSANRKLYSEKGQTISDVDVAAFDPSDGLLAIFQVKWLIEPDSTRESTRTDAEISYAIKQSIRCRHEFEKDRDRFLKQVFPNHDVGVAAVKELRCYVVARGDVGSKDDEQNSVYVLDYLLSIDIISDSVGVPLRQILSRIIDRQVEISNSIEEGAHPIRVKLAGYLIRLPGYGVGATSLALGKGTRAEEPRRNDRCICGSGRKYKKCCLELTSYGEDIW